LLTCTCFIISYCRSTITIYSSEFLFHGISSWVTALICLFSSLHGQSLL